MAERIKFDKCCCCINLRTGALILGYLGLISSIIAIGLTSWGMAGVTPPDGIFVVETPAAIGITSIILFAISLVFYSLLLAGVYQRKSSYVKAAWIYMFVYMLLQFIEQVYNRENQKAPTFILILIVLCLGIYWALCVLSYELALKEEDISSWNQGGHASTQLPAARVTDSNREERVSTDIELRVLDDSPATAAT